MPATEINGNPTAMAAFSTQLKAPELPSSLARLGTPPNLGGLFEGIAMSLLDKASTALVAAYLTKVTEEMVTYSAKVKAASASYTAADVTSSLELVAATAKLAQQGVSLVKQLTAGTGTSSTGHAHTPTPGAHAPTDPQHSA
ncbi:hypothetical protein Lfu02_02500 [Longispora fulva]|uniref:Uncharacterized protein n=1 Tax=Longispora fulva TaxID=619741 RepID=A0A8J7GGS8_9ACTN|nr:hypothetical protein [Longispora fulva]MBG6135878.1 hypothetical protein [Longispora fulva]GIG55878.1 hypothetical protein Lfu02_02500 [Longispora fulva]